MTDERARDRIALTNALLAGGNFSGESESGGEPLNVALVGVAASIMVRRSFSGSDARAITPYVMSLFGSDDPSSMKTCRAVEALVRSELGELELIEEVVRLTEAFDIASVVLLDLVRRNELDARQIEALVETADREAAAVQRFVEMRRLSARSLLARALRRRAAW